MIEEWRDIDGYSGLYIVSSFGNVESLCRKNPKYLKCSIGNRRYYTVVLYRCGTRTKHMVSRLVAEAFVPNPLDKPCINHIDGIKTNNNSTNLEWVTHSENSKHAVENGLLKPINHTGMGKKHHFVHRDGSMFYGTVPELSRKTGICKSTIYAMVLGRKYHSNSGGWITFAPEMCA